MYKRQWLSSLCKHPLDGEKGVYILPGEPAGYVGLENYFQERSILGMVVDVTEDITERRRIERERDVDPVSYTHLLQEGIMGGGAGGSGRQTGCMCCPVTAL